MRVTADETFTAVITGGQMLDITKGDVFKGDVAAYLLDSGAPVTAVDAEPVEEVEPEQDGPDQGDGPEPFDVKTATIDAVLAWVGDDAERAREAHTVEESKGDKARPRLLARLTEIVEN